MPDSTNPDCKPLLCCGSDVVGVSGESAGSDYFENYSAAGPDEDLFFNEEVSYTSECPVNYYCDPTTITIPANANRPAQNQTPNHPASPAYPPGPAGAPGPYTGTTQAGANAAAQQAAQNAANAQTFIWGRIGVTAWANEEQLVTCDTGYEGDPVFVPAGLFFSNNPALTPAQNQTAANDLAIAYGESVIVCNPTCATAKIQGLTWIWSQTGSGSTGSATAGAGSLTTPGNSSSLLTSSSFTNTCGFSISFAITVNYALWSRWQSGSPGHMAVQSIAVINGVNNLNTVVWGGVNCGGAPNPCPCADTTSSFVHNVTIPNGQTCVFKIEMFSNNAFSTGCTVSNSSFTIEAT